VATALIQRTGARRAPQLLAATVAIALVGCGSSARSASSASGPPESGFMGAALARPVAAPAFTLTDVNGQTVSLSDYRGQVTILSFLDSTCRACVLIAQQIRGALDEVAKPPPVLFVSVEPAHDTPARVAGFLSRVGLASRARYLVAPALALARVLRRYGVVTPASGQATFEASATVYLLDSGGRERVLYQEEQLTPEALAHDIRALQHG
jgi:cytochrome oxidase Cu insertion factor (SCO1/SenC/PrrC family)